MSKQNPDGLNTYLAGKTKEKIEEETGLDLGIIGHPETFISLLELKEIAQKKLERIDDDIQSLKKAIIRGQRKKKELIENRDSIIETIHELDRINRNSKIKDYIGFRKEVASDISKLGLVTGNIKQERKGRVEEVMG